MTVLGTDLGVCVIIYIINWVLACKRLEMGMEFGSTKRNRRLMSGCPRTAHLLYFGTV